MDSDNIVEVYVHHIGKSEIHEILKKLKQLTQLGDRIMSSISDFSESVNQSFAQIDQSISSIREDVEKLNAEINKLQESSGKISSDDQASLDKIQEHAKSLASSVSELDSLNPQSGGESKEDSDGSNPPA